MQIKEIKPINFLFFRKETTISALEEMLPVSQAVYREAVAENLAITGAIHWHYMGIFDMVKPFVLEISLPVAEVKKEYDGPFHFKRTEAYKCVYAFHNGSYETLPQKYDEMFKHIFGNGLTPTGINREIYINVDFNDPSFNYTEVQIGIQ